MGQQTLYIYDNPTTTYNQLMVVARKAETEIVDVKSSMLVMPSLQMLECPRRKVALVVQWMS